MRNYSKTLVAAAAGMVVSSSALAFNVETGDSDFAVSWDNTLKYSVAQRLKSATPQVAGDVSTPNGQYNTDDGDRNFGKGLISNRIDVLSELGVRYKRDSGFRISGTAWYDDVYMHSNGRSAADAGSLNQPGLAYNQFNDATKRTMGRNTELLDFFGYTRQSVGDMGLNLKAGRFTQLYGETLFFGNNGIAGAQTPLDLARALSVPNSQFKEVARPVGQVSAQLQISPTVTVGAYVQPEWRESRLPASGSYFSFGDFVGAGGNTLYGPAGPLSRSADQKPGSGQWGSQVKFKHGDSEYGVYAANFHEKLPQFYVNPAQDYALVYGKDIHTVGGSFSTVVGETNVSGEMSYRQNQPLVALGASIYNMAGPNSTDAQSLLPKGNTAHMNLSAISLFKANPIWDGASLVAEVAFNRRLSVTSNAAAVDPNSTRDAGALQLVFAPEYFQVMPETDLSIPIGVSYGLFGKSAVNGVLFPSYHGGSVSIGAKAVYQKSLNFGINYTHYVGDAGAVITTSAPPQSSYKNFHGDRDFISLSVQYAF